MFYLYLVLCADLISHLCEIHSPHSLYHVIMKTRIWIMALWLTLHSLICVYQCSIQQAAPSKTLVATYVTSHKTTN